jgi:SAM-dependent methyltransferase
MRLSEIVATKARIESLLEPLPKGANDAFSMQNFRLRSPSSIKRRLLDCAADSVLSWLTASNRKKLGFDLTIPHNQIAIGERWAVASSWNKLHQAKRGKLQSVLVQGCHAGDGAVLKWLAKGLPNVSGIELEDLTTIWKTTVPALESEYRSKIDFKQGSVDAVPFPDASFDVVTSEAVYEHVYNLKMAAKEMHRVLRPNGIAYHSIGPLYYTFAGDHCISAYGPQAGYDHLLLSDDEYRKRVADKKFFSAFADPNCSYWAQHDKFSFAKPTEYFEVLKPYFEIEYVTVVICDQSLRFRQTYPDRWQAMLDAGLDEECLCVKAMHIRARRR